MSFVDAHYNDNAKPASDLHITEREAGYVGF